MLGDHSFLEKPFSVEIAKQGRAICKKCRQKCVQGGLRIAKLIPNPVGSGKVKSWHHVKCIFEVFSKQRQTTKRIEGPHDLEGWELLDNDDKDDILKKIRDCKKAFEAKFKKSSKKMKRSSHKSKAKASRASTSEDCSSVSSEGREGVFEDNMFRRFRRAIADLTNKTKTEEKIDYIRNYFSKGHDKVAFRGDIALWCKLLLPADSKRVYANLEPPQLMKMFSRLLNIRYESMMTYLNENEIGRTIDHYFRKNNKKFKPIKDSALTINDVSDFLETLTTLSAEEEQYNHFKTFIRRCTSNDLKVIVRLISGDLYTKVTAKHVFTGLHPDAFALYESSTDIDAVVNAIKERSRADTLEVSSSTFLPPKVSPKRKSTHSEKKGSSKKEKSETETAESTAEIMETEEPQPSTSSDQPSISSHIQPSTISSDQPSTSTYVQPSVIFEEQPSTSAHAQPSPTLIPEINVTSYAEPSTSSYDQPGTSLLVEDNVSSYVQPSTSFAAQPTESSYYVQPSTSFAAQPTEGSYYIQPGMSPYVQVSTISHTEAESDITSFYGQPSTSSYKAETGEALAVEDTRRFPNYFNGLKLWPELAAREKFPEWLECFTAHGGIILNHDDIDQADKLLLVKDTVREPPYPHAPKSAQHLIVEWIKHTIQRGRLQEWQPYCVRWDPHYMG